MGARWGGPRTPDTPYLGVGAEHRGGLIRTFSLSLYARARADRSEVNPKVGGGEYGPQKGPPKGTPFWRVLLPPSTAMVQGPNIPYLDVIL